MNAGQSSFDVPLKRLFSVQAWRDNRFLSRCPVFMSIPGHDNRVERLAWAIHGIRLLPGLDWHFVEFHSSSVR
jgi:hypothetical protein